MLCPGLHSATKSFYMQKRLFFKMDYVCKFPQGDDQKLFQQHAIGLQKSFYAFLLHTLHNLVAK